MGGGGHILAVGGWCWMVEDIFWLVVDGGGYILAGGGWWWMVVDIFWLVVGGGVWLLVVVGVCGWWHSLV